MITKLINKTNYSLLARRLDQDSTRQKVIAHNIANVNTVDYQAKDVIFEDVLRGAAKKVQLETNNPYHLTSASSISGKVVNVEDTQIKNGINNVDVDEQMVELAKNQLDFIFSATYLSNLFKSLKASIRGRV